MLLQTGETYRGEPLYDRQHPHDLFMELAAVVERVISEKIGVSLYAAPVGEPAVALQRMWPPARFQSASKGSERLLPWYAAVSSS